MQTIDYTFKVNLIGTSGVGKSCIKNLFIKRYDQKQMYATTGVQFSSRILKVNDKITKLLIWDSGDILHRAIVKAYLKDCQAVIIVYDITYRHSFEAVNDYSKIIKQYLDPNVFVILVGNKMDLQQHREVQKIQGLELAAKNGYNFIEVSAYKNINIDNIFDQIAYYLVSVEEFQNQVKQQKIKLLIKQKQQENTKQLCESENKNTQCEKKNEIQKQNIRKITDQSNNIETIQFGMEENSINEIINQTDKQIK